MVNDPSPDRARAHDKPPILDVGVGDAEAPANAIPNILARLVETETWRDAATVVMGALLIGLGVWSYTGVRDSMGETQTVSLEALLGTVVRGLDVWIAEHRTDAERLARDPDLAEQAARIAAITRERGAQEACASPEAGRLGLALAGYRTIPGAVMLRVVDRTGQVLAASDATNCGARLRGSAFRARLDLAFDGTTQFVRPDPDPLLSAPAVGKTRHPIAWFLAPLPGGALALALGVVADRDLGTVFGAARPGATTEVYAFSDDGLMLTPSRFADDPAMVGPGAEPGAEAAPFSIAVRDPGGDVGAGHTPALEIAARPLTRAAALAVAARGKPAENERRGVIITPYRSYRGDEVIGAWRWLARHDVGVVAEITAAEAFATMRYLWVSFAVIGGFVVLSLIAALSSALSLSRLQRQFGRLQRLGSYTLERQISEGGMATIYLARHALLKRPTAIKVLKKHVATDEFIHRFEREVQIASQLFHPNTVQVYDFGRTREGQPYYVMEYLDGVTLAELVAHSGPVPPGRAIHVLRQVAAALREAHKQGMIHRDVKPENVMLCRRGEDDVVKLLDFGLVKNLENAWKHATSPSRSGSWARRATWRPNASSTRPMSTRAPTSTPSGPSAIS